MADYGHSLMLDPNTWDLTLDQGGNVAQTSGDYAVAQDVANRIRLFTNDAYYSPEEGIPHFLIDLGHKVSESLIRSRYREAALTVPGVANAQITDINLSNRTLGGTVVLSLKNGEVLDLEF